MAQAHRELLEADGFTCVIAGGVSSAIKALEVEPVDSIVVGLHKRQVAEDLLETLMARPLNKRGFRQLFGVRFDEDRARTLIGLAAVLVKPTPPTALAAMLNDKEPPRKLTIPDIAALTEAHALGRAGDGFERITAALRRALRSDAAVVVTDNSRIQGVDADTANIEAILVERMWEAAAAGAPMITSALATASQHDSYDDAFETLLAISTDGTQNRARVLVGVVYEGARVGIAALRPILAGIARRVAEERAVQTVNDRLAAELDAVHDIGGLDPMLGIWNRATLTRLTAMMEAACRRTKEPLAVAILNVVGMTRINEVHGHREGDTLLRHVAEVAVYVVRGSDIVARYQGDDIAVVFHGTNAQQAVKVVERIRQNVSSQPLRTDDGQEVHIRTTAGVTALGGPEDTGDRALARAAKAAGRGDEEKSPIITAFFEEHPSDPDMAAVSLRQALDGVTFGGTYRVLHEIGAGGGGGVFRGEDLGLRRPVAIKVLRPEQSQNEVLVERFRAEAATLAALRHPNLVQVYAFGLEDGHAYFVMELVEGESLFDAVTRSRKERRRIPIERIRMVLSQISSALRTLHHAGIIHRDVKPANVLIDPFRDRAVLVDVGIASRHGQRANLAGTPGYMAPEAATSSDLNESADVYGFAVTLYELLTLELPWPVDDDPLRTIQNQRSMTPKAPSEIDPLLAPLDAPLLRAMDVDPKKRHRDVDAFYAAVRTALSSLASAAPVESAPGSTEPIPDSAEALVNAPTLSWQTAPGEAEATTRGVVFRSLPRVIGARNTASWRNELGASQPRLAEALSPATLPLGWLPTRVLIELLSTPPDGYPRKETLGRDLGRASVRATFRRFFPAAAVTLAPSGTLSALPSIWGRYHSWGKVRVMPHMMDRMTVFIEDTPRVGCLCDWTIGALEQLVLLSRGDQVTVEHAKCETRGDPECVYDVTWQWDPSSDRSWRKESQDKIPKI